MAMAVFPAAEPRSFEHHVLDFLAYLEFERGLSRNTLEAYRSDLLQFGAFLHRRGTGVLAAEHSDLAAFLSELYGAESETLFLPGLDETEPAAAHGTLPDSAPRERGYAAYMVTQ